VDITIEVMLPERGSSDFTQPGHNRYPMLGIVAVYDHMKITDSVGMPRTGYIHVTGVPDARFARLKEVIEARGVGSKRAWSVLDSRISAQAKASLVADRQISVGWAQFRNLLRNRDESRDLTDADVPAAAIRIQA
jgi:hypothetical protein